MPKQRERHPHQTPTPTDSLPSPKPQATARYTKCSGATRNVAAPPPTTSNYHPHTTTYQPHTTIFPPPQKPKYHLKFRRRHVTPRTHAIRGAYRPGAMVATRWFSTPYTVGFPNTYGNVLTSTLLMIQEPPLPIPLPSLFLVRPSTFNLPLPTTYLSLPSCLAPICYNQVCSFAAFGLKCSKGKTSYAQIGREEKRFRAYIESRRSFRRCLRVDWHAVRSMLSSLAEPVYSERMSAMDEFEMLYRTVARFGLDELFLANRENVLDRYGRESQYQTYSPVPAIYAKAGIYRQVSDLGGYRIHTGLVTVG